MFVPGPAHSMRLSAPSRRGGPSMSADVPVAGAASLSQVEPASRAAAIWPWPAVRRLASVGPLCRDTHMTTVRTMTTTITGTPTDPASVSHLADETASVTAGTAAGIADASAPGVAAITGTVIAAGTAIASAAFRAVVAFRAAARGKALLARRRAGSVQAPASARRALAAAEWQGLLSV